MHDPFDSKITFVRCLLVMRSNGNESYAVIRRKEFRTLTMLSTLVTAINNRDHPTRLNRSKPYQDYPSGPRPGAGQADPVLDAAVTLVRNGKNVTITATNPSTTKFAHDVNGSTGAVFPQPQVTHHFWVIEQRPQANYLAIPTQKSTYKDDPEFFDDRHFFDITRNLGHKDTHLEQKNCGDRISIKMGKSHLQSMNFNRWEWLFTIP